MFLICEQKLLSPDLCPNINKSVCIRVGPRFNANCLKLTTCNGHELEWVNTCCYLGVFFVTGRSFKCSWEKCKTSCYRSFNAIFGRFGRYASAETIIQLLQCKCMPVLPYSLEACPINSSDYTSLEHPVTMAFMKIFKTNSVTVINECQEAFGFDTVRRQIIKRTINFVVKMCKNINAIGSAVATKYAFDELEFLKRLM